MALYIHPENQELLWNIVNQTPYLTNMLSSQTESQKQSWFRSIIETFYNMNRYKTLDKTQLNQLNKDTLAYMIQIIRVAPPMESNYIYDRNKRTVNTFMDSVPVSTNIPTPPVVPDTRADEFNRQFIDRRKEYDSMLEKKAPAEMNFREKVEDEAISNMDELIKRQIQEREAEFKLYSPPPPVPTSGPTGKDIEKVDPLPLPLPLASPSPINNIKFAIEETQESTYITGNQTEISELKTTVETLTGLIKDLKSTIHGMSKEIKEIKDRFDFGGTGSPIPKRDSGILLAMDSETNSLST